MKKVFCFIISLMLAVSVFGQLDTVDIGSAPGAGDGEILYTAFLKVNTAIDKLNDTIVADSIIFNYLTGALTDGAPTLAEINAVLGAPSTKTAGFTARIKDTNGSGLIYYLVTDGTNWYWIASTLAL